MGSEPGRADRQPRGARRLPWGLRGCSAAARWAQEHGAAGLSPPASPACRFPARSTSQVSPRPGPRAELTAPAGTPCCPRKQLPGGVTASWLGHN